MTIPAFVASWFPFPSAPSPFIHHFHKHSLEHLTAFCREPGEKVETFPSHENPKNHSLPLPCCGSLFMGEHRTWRNKGRELVVRNTWTAPFPWSPKTTSPVFYWVFLQEVLLPASLPVGLPLVLINREDLSQVTHGIFGSPYLRIKTLSGGSCWMVPGVSLSWTLKFPEPVLQ